MVMTGYFSWAVKGSMIAVVLSLCEGLLKLQACKLWNFSLFSIVRNNVLA